MALLTALVVVIVPSAAGASAQWSAPVHVDSTGLLSVSCPSASFCVAVDSAGNVLTFDGSTWNAPEDIDPAMALSSVSCPSSSFCVAVDQAGRAVTFNGSTWNAPEDIDSAVALSSVSCPSSSFCVAVDQAGNAVTFNGSTWASPQRIDRAAALSSVSCPSSSFCVAIDEAGNAATFNGSAWNAPAAIDPSHSLSSVSCPSASFCLAVDANTEFVTYDGSSWSAPTGLVVGELTSVSCLSAWFCAAVDDGNGWAITYDGSVWGPNPLMSIEMGGGLRGVSCPFATFCAAVDDAGNAFTYSVPPPSPVTISPPVISGSAVPGALLTEAHGSWADNPTGFNYQWEDCDASGHSCSAIRYATSQAYLISDADVGHTIRVEEVAANVSGSSSPAISASSGLVVLPLGTALSKSIVPRGGTTLRALLRHGGYSVAFDAPGTGRLVITWYLKPRQAGAKRLIAKLSVTMRHAGIKQIMIRLIGHDRRVLMQSKRAIVIATGTFTPSGRPAVSITKPFVLGG